MNFNVAVQEPEARIVGSEVDDGIATSRYDDCVLSNSVFVDTNARFVALVPAWFRTPLAFFATALITTMNVLGMLVRVDKTSHHIVLRVSNVYHVEGVAVKMYWVGVLVGSDCCKDKLDGLIVLWDIDHMGAKTGERGWVAVSIEVTNFSLLCEVRILCLWWDGRKNEISTIDCACLRVALKIEVEEVEAVRTGTVQQALRVKWRVFGVFVCFDLYFVNYRSWQAEILQECAEGCIQGDLQKKIRQT